MLTRYLGLAEYFWLAEQVTGTEAAVLVKASRVELADSALHAPAAGFGDQDFYPDLLDKAAVLTCRLAWNHPLPHGNKRAAWAALRMFTDLNGCFGSPIHPMSMRPRKRCSPLPLSGSTRRCSPSGSASALPPPLPSNSRKAPSVQLRAFLLLPVLRVAVTSR